MIDECTHKSMHSKCLLWQYSSVAEVVNMFLFYTPIQLHTYIYIVPMMPPSVPVQDSNSVPINQHNTDTAEPISSSNSGEKAIQWVVGQLGSRLLLCLLIPLCK